MFAKYIAHACGGINNITYSNSLEALNLAYNNGHRFIEFDISKTSDDHYVLIHDWEQTRKKLFGKIGRVNLAEFTADQMVNNYQQLTLADILIWFKQHPDCYLVSDSKDILPEELLAYIKKNSPELISRTIVQIYYFNQYKQVKKYAPKAIIFAAYHDEYKFAEIIDFIKLNPCDAVSMTQEKAKANFAFLIKKELDLPTITFTINDKNMEEELKKLALDCFFTDFLICAR